MNINRREMVALTGAAAFLCPISSPSFADEVNDFAKIAAERFVARGVLPVHNPADDLFKPGALITTNVPGYTLHQRHVDWYDMDRDLPAYPDSGIRALVDNIVDFIHPESELKTFTLLIPKNGANFIGDAALLSYGHLKLRVLRELMVLHDDNSLPTEVWATRADILFATKNG
jgi:hypothetical protein